jgi:hypothetical protein
VLPRLGCAVPCPPESRTVTWGNPQDPGPALTTYWVVWVLGVGEGVLGTAPFGALTLSAQGTDLG